MDLIIWILKLIWKLVKGLLGIKSDKKTEPTELGQKMGGLFDHRIPTNWTATYNYRNEYIRITLHHHKTQPAEFEFRKELIKIHGNRINVSETFLVDIKQG